MEKLIFVFGLFMLFINSIYAQQVIFQKTYGDSLAQEAYDVKRTLDGGYILTGVSFKPTVSINDPDVYVVKTDATGAMQWNYTYGSFGEDFGTSVVQNPDSSYVIFGNTVQPFRVNSDCYILKIDPLGILITASVIGEDSEYEQPKKMIRTTDGGYVVTGSTEAGFGGNLDFFVAKLDQNLNAEFSNAYGDSSAELMIDVDELSDGGFICVGSNQGLGALTTSLLKLDNSGNLIWSKKYFSATGLVPIGVYETADSNLIVSGRIYSPGTSGFDYFLMKTDTAGNILWSKSYGGVSDDYPASFAQTTSGHFIITGVTLSFGFPNGISYVIETDENGVVLWSKLIADAGNLNSVISNADGTIAIASGTNVNGAGGFDMLLLQADSTGNFGCGQTVPSTITTTIPITVSPSVLSSIQSGSVVSANAMVDLTGTESTICFGTGVAELSLQNPSLWIYPNPSHGIIQIDFPSNDFFHVQLLNVLGKVVDERSQVSGVTTFDYSKLDKGIYFIRSLGRLEKNIEKIVLY